MPAGNGQTEDRGQRVHTQQVFERFPDPLALLLPRGKRMAPELGEYSAVSGLELGRAAQIRKRVCQISALGSDETAREDRQGTVGIARERLLGAGGRFIELPLGRAHRLVHEMP